MTEMAKAENEMMSYPSINEDLKLQSSISPEYKSSWNDVNITANYDQYARSVNSSRLTTHDTTPPKDMSLISPRSNGSHGLTDRSTSKRNRVKLNKTNGQTVQQTSSFNIDVKPGLKQECPVEIDSELLTKAEKHPSQERQTKVNVKVTSVKVADDYAVEITQQQKEHDKKKNKDNIDKHSMGHKTAHENSAEVKRLSHGQTRNSGKSSAEFTPPVVTAVDFREPALSQAVKHATKNGLLIESPDFNDERPLNGSITRMSTLLMASYLGMSCNPNPNVISSFSVKQILPPLHPKSKIRRKPNLKRKNLEDTLDYQITPRKSDPAVAEGNDSRELRPLRDAHLYKWKHDAVSYPNGSRLQRHHMEKEVPYRLPHRNNEIDTIFDQIVRWRSKVRHCGKPAMYRRITSPTLGEVALSRKLTDRLPTRQSRKTHHKSYNMHTHEEEDWKRSPSKIAPVTSVKQYIKERLRDTHNDDDMTSPSVMEGFYDVTMKMKQTSLQCRDESNKTSEILKLPLPDLSLRKRQPVWQRMR